MKKNRLAAVFVTLSLFACSQGEQPGARAELDVLVEMRDGVSLLTDVYFPDGDGPFPTILSRVPYGTKSEYIFQPAVGKFFSDNGFVYVSQNVRGRFGSEGLFTAYLEGQEIPDGYDTVDWIASQEWSDGNVGVMGESYYGYTTLAAAISGHPAIKAISPANITLIREKQALDGAFPLQASGLWTLDMDDVENGEYQDTSDVDLYHLPLITMGKAHGLRDVLWRERVSGYSEAPRAGLESISDFEKIRVPTLHFGGWYDSFTRGTINLWQGISRDSVDEGARSAQWLVMGPWDHDAMSVHLSGTMPATNIGKREIGPAASTTYGETLLEFFNHFLKGEENGFGDLPRVRYFNIGDNGWRYSESWPPEDIRYQTLYLDSDGDASIPGNGRLETSRGDQQGEDKYSYDPESPVTITATTNVWGRAAGLPDRSVLLVRDDVLTYETPVLEEDLEITGHIAAVLYAATSALDTDFTAALVDVYPDGYSLLIQEGLQRASFRNVPSTPSNVKPGNVYEYTIDLWATSYTVPAGHKLRLEISSSNFPRFARNLNNGEPFGMSDRIEVAEQIIHHSEQFPSRLLLPVIPE